MYTDIKKLLKQRNLLIYFRRANNTIIMLRIMSKRYYYLAETDQYYCMNVVAFDEARDSVGTYTSVVCVVHTSQHIRLYTTCTHHIVHFLRLPQNISKKICREVHMDLTESNISGHAHTLFKRKLTVVADRQLCLTHSVHYTFITSVHHPKIKKLK